jgi:hypothetical protein
MGLLINGQKMSKPLINGIPHNILINGQKIFTAPPLEVLGYRTKAVADFVSATYTEGAMIKGGSFEDGTVDPLVWYVTVTSDQDPLGIGQLGPEDGQFTETDWTGLYVTHATDIGGMEYHYVSEPLYGGEVVLIPKSTTTSQKGKWSWTDTAYNKSAWAFHDGDRNTYAEGEGKGSIHWITYDMGAGGKKIDSVETKMWLNNSYNTGYIILTNTKPQQDAVPSNKVIIRYNANSTGMIQYKFDCPDKTNRYQYLSFSTQGGDASRFYECDIRQIM